MSRSLKLYITWLVGASVVALLLTSFVFSENPALVLGMRPEISIIPGQPTVLNVLTGLGFWTLITLFAGALPVRMPRGTLVSRGDRARSSPRWPLAVRSPRAGLR